MRSSRNGECDDLLVRNAYRACATGITGKSCAVSLIQMPERMDLVESFSRPLHSSRRFLAGRISTLARDSGPPPPFSFPPRKDILVHVCVCMCVCVCVRVCVVHTIYIYIYIYRFGTNLQVKLLSRSVSTARSRQVHPRAHDLVYIHQVYKPVYVCGQSSRFENRSSCRELDECETLIKFPDQLPTSPVHHRRHRPVSLARLGSVTTVGRERTGKSAERLLTRAAMLTGARQDGASEISARRSSRHRYAVA